MGLACIMPFNHQNDNEQKEAYLFNMIIQCSYEVTLKMERGVAISTSSGFLE